MGALIEIQLFLIGLAIIAAIVGLMLPRQPRSLANAQTAASASSDATKTQTPIPEVNVVSGNIVDIRHKYQELAQNDFLVGENDCQASVVGNRG